MSNWRIKLSLFLNYFVFAILLNSVGTVILQVQHNYGVSESSASVLEAFKDLSIAVVSFLVSSWITRLGYKNAMLFGLALTTLACFAMPSVGGFAMTKVLFAAVGASFALIKMSVYSAIGLVTADRKEHLSLMSFIESFFMIGILTGYFVFSAFIDDTHPESVAWLQVYYWLGSLSALAFVLLLSAPLDESAVKPDTPTSNLLDFVYMFRMMVFPLVLVFIGCAFFYVLIEQSIMSWLPTFNNKVLQLPATLSIQMASILAGSSAAGRFLAGLLLKRFHWIRVLSVCLLLAAALVVLAIPLASNVAPGSVSGWADAPLAAFVFPLIGLFLAPVYPALNSAILSALPTRQHGLMSGLIILFSALGGTTGSLITGSVFEHFDGQTAFYFSLIPMGILMALLFVFNKISTQNTTRTA
jgi:MFS transporter, FHS family, glucose/mannose:H+ symporter